MKTLWWQTVGTGNCHLVLLHGWGLNAEVWRCVSEELASHFTLHLVDLPGYGYAAVPEAMKKEWQSELEKYLISRKSLAGLVLLTDIRHPLKFFDEQMLHWAKDGELEVHVLLTKADKLKYGAAKNTLQQTRSQLNKLKLPFSIQLFSAQDRIGLEELSLKLGNWLALPEQDEPTDNEPTLAV